MSYHKINRCLKLYSWFARHHKTCELLQSSACYMFYKYSQKIWAENSILFEISRGLNFSTTDCYHRYMQCMQVSLVTQIPKCMHIEMFNTVKNTRKLLLVWFIAKPNQLEQKLCNANYRDTNMEWQLDTIINKILISLISKGSIH